MLSMANLKAIINFFDIFFATFWGFTFIEIAPILMINGYADLFSEIDNTIKALFAFVGLVYAIMRAYFYFQKSVIYVKIQHEELRKKKQENNKEDQTL
jgi:hypothetical protein